MKEWSRADFGNVSQTVQEADDAFLAAEIAYDTVPSEINKNQTYKAQTDLTKKFETEEAFWTQKANLKWLKEGDCNTKFFH